MHYQDYRKRFQASSQYALELFVAREKQLYNSSRIINSEEDWFSIGSAISSDFDMHYIDRVMR